MERARAIYLYALDHIPKTQVCSRTLPSGGANMYAAHIPPALDMKGMWRLDDQASFQPDA